jgi:hypothetical protein
MPQGARKLVDRDEREVGVLENRQDENVCDEAADQPKF